MIFQLFTLVSKNPLLDYSYCALGTERQSGTRLLLIAEDMISLEVPADETDIEELYKNYLPTSRKIEYDLDRLEEMIRSYTNQNYFNFVADFVEFRHVGLTFARPPEWKNWSEYIDLTHPNIIAREIVKEVFQNMEPLLAEVFEIA